MHSHSITRPGHDAPGRGSRGLGAIRLITCDTVRSHEGEELACRRFLTPESQNVAPQSPPLRHSVSLVGMPPVVRADGPSRPEP